MEDSERLDEILEWALGALKSAGDFTMEQAPIVVQEFYMWCTASHIFWAVFGLILILLAAYLKRWASGHNKHGMDFIEDSDGGIYLPLGVIAFIGTMFLLSNIYNLIYIYVAPRLYMIETVAGYLSGG